MSIKSFHILFITVSSILAFGFAAWSVYFHLTVTSITYLILGIASFVVGIVLIVYGMIVMRKLRRI